MKYPYIGKGIESGSIVLIYGKDSAIVMDSKTWAAKDSEDTEVDESYFKNITAEYLANTYGEVKSKEHAEFIVRLAEVNGFDIGIKSNIPSVFEFSGMLLNVYANDISSFAHNVESKLITIPLPPECEEKIYRYEGMEQKPKHFDCVCTKCGGRCCIGNCDGWPKVGDEVQTNFGKGVVELPPDVKGCFVVQVNGGYLQLKHRLTIKTKNTRARAA